VAALANNDVLAAGASRRQSGVQLVNGGPLFFSTSATTEPISGEDGRRDRRGDVKPGDLFERCVELAELVDEAPDMCGPGVTGAHHPQFGWGNTEFPGRALRDKQRSQ
jgi:hypothetical protein